MRQVLLILVFLLHQAAHAATLPSETDPPQQHPYFEHSLGSVPYLRSSVADNPFVNSFVASSLEALISKYAIAVAERELNGSAFALRVLGQVGWKRVALEVSGFANLLSGVDPYSALILGSSLTYSVAPQLKFQVFKGTSSVLTFAFRTVYEQGISISPLTAGSNGIISASAADAVTGLILFPVNWILSPRVIFGISPIRWLGLWAQLAYLGQLPTSTQPQLRSSLQYAFQATLPLLQFSKVPLAFQAGISQTVVLGGAYSLTPVLNIAIHETFRSQYNFGLEFTRLLSSQPSTSIGLHMMMHY